MYGTVARLRIKAGHEKAIIDGQRQWEKERRPKVKGAIASYLYRLDKDPQAMMLAVVFKDKASYFANANDPEQDRWYKEFRQHLERAPQWNDGEVLTAS